MSQESSVLERRAAAEAYPLGTFSSYGDAQRVAERLSDVGFPRERVSVVPSADGDASKSGGAGRLIGTNIALGAWLGLLGGIVVSVFLAEVRWMTALPGGLLLGAASGALVGSLAAGVDRRIAKTDATLRRRPGYTVEVDRTHAVEARLALDKS